MKTGIDRKKMLQSITQIYRPRFWKNQHHRTNNNIENVLRTKFKNKKSGVYKIGWDNCESDKQAEHLHGSKLNFAQHLINNNHSLEFWNQTNSSPFL